MRRSVRQGLWERFLHRWLSITPYRCEKCDERFFSKRSRHDSANEPEDGYATAAGKAGASGPPSRASDQDARLEHPGRSLGASPARPPGPESESAAADESKDLSSTEEPAAHSARGKSAGS